MTEKIRVVTQHGNWFDMDVPSQDFNFHVFVGNIRSAGYLLTDKMYTPHPWITSIFIYDTDAPPPDLRPQGTSLQ